MSAIDEAPWIWFGIPPAGEIYGPMYAKTMNDEWADSEMRNLVGMGYVCHEDMPGLRFFIAPDADYSAFVFIRRVDP